ncbi:Rieske 2Fe-2S domain-containing protein [Hydrogenophaga sp. BPS33]|uniref:Rieske 2Fe-2S domain-containing protein n=1 Tax=Hydrogenophaga sp. BPS33 TaxID=2651974 RepID=UPI0013204972|nr:Rieske 2Fe-2S domain-containing protein [Hydrogenophaga sp. BPS33]QHE85513.1 Rieske 2Fe-2S domain-containing protein [Hydrogenophaga sp. BPS33]
MLSKEENEKLCHVSPGTPMGDVFRRFWNPFLMSSELPHPGCDPVRITLLGEELVAFRDASGQLGLLEEGCLHRGASLALGRLEEGGVRCIYHGWKFDFSGRLLETPNHLDPRVRDRLRAVAYPVREAGGLIWAYMGPPEHQPAFPDWHFMDLPVENLRVTRVEAEVNYMQQLEGGADTTHVGILHTNDARPGWMEEKFVATVDETNPAALASDDLAPAMEFETTEFGFRYASLRKLRGDTPQRNVRIVPIAMPSTRVIPSPMVQFVVFEVPMTDTRTATIGITYRLDGKQVDGHKLDEMGGRHDPKLFNPANNHYVGTWANRFGQDRQRMKDDWSGIRGIVAEDLAIAMSQGPIVNRAKEHLVAADMALVKARKQLLDSADRVRNGGTPIGVNADFRQVLACDQTVAQGTEWKSLLPLTSAAVA